jgi:hypothetical protein
MCDERLDTTEAAVKQQLIRAITKKPQYLTPLQQGAFIAIGLLLIWPSSFVFTASIRSRHYVFLLLLLPLWLVAVVGALLIRAAAFSSPQYKEDNKPNL